jgi:hypothetical protein
MRTSGALVWLVAAAGLTSLIGCKGDDEASAGGSPPGTDAATDAQNDSPEDVSSESVDDGDAGTSDEDAGDVGPGLTCGKLLQCDQGCGSDSSCTDGCYAKATGVAQGLFDAFTACIDAHCAGSDAADCDTTAATGPCVSYLVGCEQDQTVAPPDPDGGGVVQPDAGGPTYNCGQLNTCLSGCTGDAGSCVADCNSHATPQATALLAALNSCLATACPSTPGGPCEHPGLECSGCIEQVTLAQPNTCADPYVACNSDTSNSPDGGPPVPTVLVSGGTLSTLLTGLIQPASTIVVNNGWLYFTQVVEGSPVYRFWVGDGSVTYPDGGLPFGDGGATTPDGGPVLENLGPPQPTPVSLAVDANNVYVWSVGTFKLSSSVNNQDGTVVQVPLNGGPAITLRQNLEAFYDAGYLNAVTVDSNYVYWVEGAAGNDGAIMRAPIGGGSATPIYTGQYVPQAVATDGTNVYWANWGTFDSQGRSNNDGTLWQGPVGGGTPIQLASNLGGPSTIGLDSNNVYWVNLGTLGINNFPALNSGSVMKTPIGGGPVTTIATGQSVPFSILVDNGTVYWTEYGLSAPGLIMSASTAGGTVTPLVSGLNDPSALAIAGKTLLWTNANSSPSDGFVMALALP